MSVALPTYDDDNDTGTINDLLIEALQAYCIAKGNTALTCLPMSCSSLEC